MRYRIPILLLALLPAHASAAHLVIAGQVVDEQGRPLSGVRAALLEVAELHTTPDRRLDPVPQKDVAVAASDVEGFFVLTAPADGMWTVRLEAKGRTPLEHLLQPLQEPTDLPVAQLRRGRLAKLRVLDRAHRPAPARVTIERPPLVGLDEDRIASHAAWRPAPEWLETDVEGRVRLTIDREERRWLEVTADGFVARRLDLGELPIGEGSTELEIILDPARIAFGRVVDAREAPVPGARVLMVSTESGSRPGAVPCAGVRSEEDARSTDAGGGFVVANLSPGSYRLTVCAAGFAPVAVPGVEIPPAPAKKGSPSNAPVDVGTVILVPGAVIAGRIVDAAGEPLTGATVRKVPPEGDRRHASGTLRALSGRDGAFELTDLQAGEVLDLRVDLEGFARRTLSGVKAPTREPLEIVLERTGKVAGWVFDPDGAAVAGAEVTVFSGPAADARRRPATAHSGEDGGFVVAGVVPGRVSLLAAADGYLNARVAGLEVPAGGAPEAVELVLERAAVVEGQVLRPSGEPLAGVTVRIFDPAAERSPFGSTVTGDDGRFSFPSVPPGSRALAAEHRSGQRRVEELEVYPGTNEVELVLAVAGVEVAGRVFDVAAAAVAGAWVELRDERGSRRLASAPSGVDGNFSFADVLPGAYTLTARAEGSGCGRLEGPLAVREVPVDGLEIRLEAGTTLSGRAYGLDLDELARVEVRATARGTVLRAGLDFDGRYTIRHLDAGRWRVRAEVPGRGKQASGEVTVEPDASAATLDLDFDAGYSLAGHAVHGGEPVAGAAISVSGLDVAHHARASSDHRGAFRLGGLPAGTYRLVLTARGGALRHSEEIAVSWDRDLLIELGTGRVAGWVLDGGGAAVAGVRVTLRPSAAPGAAGGARGYSVVSDSQGRFDLASVDAGSWRLAASREGYATVTESIELGVGEVREGLVLELEEAAGVSFTVAAATGVPAEVRFAMLDAMGEPVAGGSAATLEGGRVRLATVPAGRWELLIRASVPGAGTLSQPILAPGELGTLALPAAGTLRVKVAELAGDPVAAAATLFGSDGRLYRSVGAGGTVDRRWPLVGGRATIPNVTADLLTVRLEAADGRSWTGSVRVPAGGVAELGF